MPRPSTRDRWDWRCSALHQSEYMDESRWHRSFAASKGSRPKGPSRGGSLALPWYSCQRHYTAGTWCTCTCSFTQLVLSFVLVRALGSMQSSKGLDSWYPPASPRQNCLASPAKSTSDDLLDRLQGSACSTIRIASSHRVRCTVTFDGIALHRQTDDLRSYMHEPFVISTELLHSSQTCSGLPDWPSPSHDEPLLVSGRRYWM
ncbi:hypothetical protein J3E69DRAFT_326797 [Trichoderma sp. SZMC 28015]